MSGEESVVPDERTYAEKEPVKLSGLIIGVVEALIVLLGSFGLSITQEQHFAIIAFLGAAFTLVAFLVPYLTALKTREKVTPNSSVVEHVNDDGQVLAGEANELPTGDVIREIGSLAPEAVNPDQGTLEL